MLHRWVGLFLSVFLLMVGLTGAVIAWDHELDWLDPQLFRVDTARALPALELARRLEASDPRLHVSYLPLSLEPGESLSLFVQPNLDARTQRPYELGFDDVMLDPADGRVLGHRQYKPRYSVHLGDAGGTEVGLLVTGLVAIGWTLDAFVVLYVSFSSRKVWRKAFAFRFGQGAHKLGFDLHRSSWVWLRRIALLSATRVWSWAKKRVARARSSAAARTSAAHPAPGE